MEDDDASAPMKVPVPAKCCNCNVVGHFASDPTCPKKIAYMQSRRLRADPGKPTKKQQFPTGPTPIYVPGGPTCADLLKPGSNQNPSGYDFVDKFSPSGMVHRSGSQGPSGTFAQNDSNSSKLGPSGTQDDTSTLALV